MIEKKTILLVILLAGLTTALYADPPLAWSHGILAMVDTTAPDVPIYAWDAGTVECPSIVISTDFHLKNFGTEPINASCPIMQPQDGFSRTSNCPCSSVLAPGQISTCHFRITFAPDTDGQMHDTLRIQTNAWNGFGGFVRIPVSGLRVTTPASPQVVMITFDSLDAHLAWNPIFQSIHGCSLSTVTYHIYRSSSYAGPFDSLGSTSDTDYVQAGAADSIRHTYYQVTADTP